MTNFAKDITSMIGTQVPIQSTVLTTCTCLQSNRKATSLTAITREEEKLPQAAVEPSNDTRVVLVAPEIELTFSDDEPVIGVTSYY